MWFLKLLLFKKLHQFWIFKWLGLIICSGLSRFQFRRNGLELTYLRWLFLLQRALLILMKKLNTRVAKLLGCEPWLLLKILVVHVRALSWGLKFTIRSADLDILNMGPHCLAEILLQCLDVISGISRAFVKAKVKAGKLVYCSRLLQINFEV